MVKYSFLCSLLALPLLGFGATLLDPAVEEVKFGLNQPEQRKQAAAYDNAPDGAKMLHAKWDAGTARYLEFSFSKPPVLPVFKSGSLKTEIFAPEGVAIDRLNFRIIDATGETLQYILARNLKPGRQVIEFNLTDANKASWGGNKNSKVDFPAKFFGMSIDFSAKEGAGELWIGKITFEPAPMELGDLVIDLGATPIRIGQGDKRKQSCENVEVAGRKGLKVNWNAADAPWLEFGLPELPKIEAFESARFTVEILVPENFKGQWANLRLNDVSGETFQFQLPLDAAPGWRNVAISVDKSGKPNSGSWGGDKNKVLDFPVRLMGFSVDYPKESGAGELTFGKVYLVKE